MYFYNKSNGFLLSMGDEVLTNFGDEGKREKTVKNFSLANVSNVDDPYYTDAVPCSNGEYSMPGWTVIMI